MKSKNIELIESFLKSNSIAVAGYSTTNTSPANGIFKKFKDNGYNVVAVNPRADEIKNIKCYKTLSDIPDKPDAVMICTNPKATLSVLEDCKKLGITKAWIHRSFGTGSYHNESIEFCSKNGIDLIPAGCPMMFIKPDFGHKIVKTIISWQGKI